MIFFSWTLNSINPTKYHLYWSAITLKPIYTLPNLSPLELEFKLEYQTQVGIQKLNTDLRVPLLVQAAYLPQAYKLCSVRAILSQTYGN